MVAALSCADQTKYDAFMTNQPHVLAEQRVMDAYFRKASGPYSGQKMEDDFITLLANNQSSISGIGQGRVFCLNSEAEYTAVSALKTPDELNRFVTNAAPGAAPMVQVASATVAADDIVLPALSLIAGSTNFGTSSHHTRCCQIATTATPSAIGTATRAAGETGQGSSLMRAAPRPLPRAARRR